MNLFTSTSVSLAFSLFGFAGIGNSAIAQNSADTSGVTIKKEIIDNGYYKYEITGNKSVDADNQRIAKGEFIAKHLDQYEKMKASNQQNVRQPIDYKEYLLMPANKKAHIDANADKYYFTNK